MSNEFPFKTIQDGVQNLSVREMQPADSSSKVLPISDWITFNVGGKHFTTTRATITTKEPSSMLARMFAGNENGYSMTPSVTDDKGAFLIDRSPEYFEPILNYLRHGEIILDRNVNPKGVLEEAKFYGMESMVPVLERLLALHESVVSDGSALRRHDVVRCLIATPTSCELRFQGVNLARADLSKPDLRRINFKGRGNGYTRAHKLSPALAELMGEESMPRQEVVKRIWAIVKERNLFDENNKQFVICDDALYKVIGCKRFRRFGMMKYLKTHFHD